jgi:excisionase family DNA binding protein
VKGLALAAAATNPALMDTVPRPEAGNRLTIRQYQSRWLELYDQKFGDTDGTSPPGGSCAAGDTTSVVAFARAQRGKPYVFGAAGPDAYDCSGLTLAAYATIGIQLPHASIVQARMGAPVAIEPTAVQAGDLVFFYSPDGGDLGHVAIAISATEEIQAPHTGDVVKVTPIRYDRVQAIRRLVTSRIDASTFARHVRKGADRGRHRQRHAPARHRPGGSRHPRPGARTKLYELINQGQLRPVRIGRSLRVPVAELERFVEALRSNGSVR